MTKTMTSEEPLADRQSRQFSVPVANMRAGCAIAHIDAFREVLPELIRFHDSLDAGNGGASLTPTLLRARVMEIIDAINDKTKVRWEEYIRLAALLPMEGETLREAGLPDHITYDPAKGIPFLTWMTEVDGPMASWRQIHINILEDTSGQPFVLTPPFRPISIDCLPKQVVRIQITDPVHAAAAAVDEVISSALGDLLRARSAVSARDNWVRMRMVSNFYTAIAQGRIKDMALDDFKDWVISLPEKISILNAPAEIARHGSSAVMIQVLAMRTVASFIGDCLDRAEQEPENTTQEMRVSQVIDEMQTYAKRITARTNSYNELLITEQGLNLRDYIIQMVNRPAPRGTPFIALVPKSLAEENPVAELSRATG